MTDNRLLEGVLTVLAEQGVGALSVRSVAAAAGVSPAQVQYYYRTKTELVRAGFEYAGTQFLEDVAAAQPNTLMDVVRQWLPLDDSRERRARVWLAYTTISAVDPELAAASAQLDEELRRWFVDRGLSATAASQLFALIDGVTVQCLMMPRSARPSLVERTIVPFISGLEATS
ncbi:MULTISPECIES: TetR/AcrR family transcriptional regulator [Rhodococcus]|uniref:TetR/AcrR family transcriptional regulator n=1 Tax=Rhodococcus cerastii TaxID=908616 RepID=A0ABU4CXI4_9NOCA|nr:MULTISPECIES: TetR/AcrR family transcriptional regulator [Rhodococcus]KAA0927870.1 TetR/AcrR family transcriptional regulator [Rhodococcus sp. ANT_H53B]MDI9925659.1 TetR/AcrR family transcriptional regulator [Rhodococcus sp. IEGM 1341]MDV6302184.1 TetR/AcrR family transcriptional regulator [Rhodococcus cerastii]MDV7988637.1 TetR/AcrR family transcriptional regulator [Rhodococcus sp. IEGM 1374]